MVKFLSGLLFNVLMGVVLASVLGVDAAYGAAAGAVIPTVLGNFMPACALMEGVFTEVWTGEVVKKLRGGTEAGWLNGVPDYSAKAENDIIHLVDVGGEVDVIVNNTTYPIEAQEIKDGDIPIGLDKFQTKKTAVTDDELYACSYDKMGTTIQSHSESLVIARYQKAAHSLAPNSLTDKTPVIKTSGEKDASGRNKMVRKDIIALKRALDKLQVPTVGRRLVLCSDHINDLLEDDQKFRDQYYNYQSGKVANMYGFEVYEFENCPYYDKNGVKKAFGSVPGATDFQASFCFYTKRAFQAHGTTKMYYRDAVTNPDYQQSEVNFRDYFIAMPKKMDAMGAIYSWDGTSEQTKDAVVSKEKNWHDARKEAAAG